MAIHRLLENSAFGPEEIERMVLAYEQVAAALVLKNREGPVIRIVAQKIIEIVRIGELDPDQICKRAIEELGIARAA
jgi:hypothetical protein